MKHKITGLIIGLAAFALTAVTVQAGEINANEQSVISAVSQSFSYNGATYVVKSSYIAQGKAKLAEDEVDLSASQAQGYISQFHGSYQELVEEGYCDLISGTPSNDSEDAEPQHSKKTSEANKLLLKSILGKPGSAEKNQKKQETDEFDSQATPIVTETPAGVDDTWDKEQDLGSSITFEKTDKSHAKNGEVTISGNGTKFSIDLSLIHI